MDEDGYLKFQLPWSFTVSYGVTMSENTGAQIRVKKMRYPYKLTHTLNFSGEYPYFGRMEPDLFFGI